MPLAPQVGQALMPWVRSTFSATRICSARDAAAGWPLRSGKAMALSGDQLDATANDAVGAWCVPSSATPRAANGICAAPTP